MKFKRINAGHYESGPYRLALERDTGVKGSHSLTVEQAEKLPWLGPAQRHCGSHRQLVWVLRKNGQVVVRELSQTRFCWSFAEGKERAEKDANADKRLQEKST